MLLRRKKIWENRAELNKEDMYKIATKYFYSLPFSAILAKRGYGQNTELAVEEPLVFSPLLLPDIDKAVKIILERTEAEKGISVAICNDYDVDGSTSGQIMFEIMEKLGASPFIITPNRETDGYGISKRIIDEIVDKGCDFIITTDNGISAKEEIEYAKSKGCTVIVTDHHEVPYEIDENGNRKEILPPADAIIDPKRNNSKYPFKDICGAMVAYKVAECILQSIPMVNPEEEEAFLRRWEELAGIGTVCDVMPLVSENRTIVRKAIEHIKEGSSYIGIRQLLKEQNVDTNKFNVYCIGFTLGPAINSCSRMTGSVELATKLLQEKDHIKAQKIAVKIKKLNDERKGQSTLAEEQALELVKKMPEKKIHILHLKDISPHILGIVAGRIKEITGHPCICVSDVGNNILKGSGRSIEGYNMFESLSKHKDLYTRFGGHEQAIGISFPKENLEEIDRLLNEDMKDFDEELFANKKYVDLFIDMSKVTEGLCNEIELLEPFGTGNPQPLFGCLDVCVTKISRMGSEKQYAKLQIKDSLQTVEAVYFGNSDILDKEIEEKYGKEALTNIYRGVGKLKMDFLYNPSINVWKDKTSVQYIISDYRM